MVGWRCVEQQYIAVALVGVGVELPKCATLPTRVRQAV